MAINYITLQHYIALHYITMVFYYLHCIYIMVNHIIMRACSVHDGIYEDTAYNVCTCRFLLIPLLKSHDRVIRWPKRVRCWRARVRHS